jgi:hypothetical protein
VYINLLDAKEPKLIFSNDKSDTNLNKSIMNEKDYCKKIIVPSTEELALHNKFLKKEFKKNYY